MHFMSSLQIDGLAMNNVGLCIAGSDFLVPSVCDMECVL